MTEQNETQVTAVTGKPLEEYEPYVELLSHAMANGLALVTERDFLISLDPSLPLHEAMREHAREAIRWRFAFDIDRIVEAGRECTGEDV